MYGDQIIRSSLGRNGFIGELYNAKTESLTCRSLFKSSFPSNLVHTQDISRTELDFRMTENIMDRFDLLQVEPELQVSVLCGLISLEGSGKFLTEEKKSEKVVSCSLVCKYQTVTEKLFVAFDEIIKHVDVSALKEPDYTHVVCEINWGANCLLSLESIYDSESKKKEIEGFLKGKLSFLGSSLSGKGKYEKKNSEEKSQFAVKVWADFVSDNMPNSIESFSNLISSIPSLLKKVNNGKGKPLNYVLVPLSTIKKLAKMECAANVIVKAIDESFLISVVCLFDEIGALKRSFYDILQEMLNHKKYINNEDIVCTRKHLESLKVKESEFKLIISEDLFKVKSGEKSIKDLIKRVEKFKAQDLKLYTYEDHLEFCENINQKIESVKNYLSAGAEYLGRGEKFNSLVNQNVSSEFVVLVISTEFEQKNPELHTNTCHYFLTLVHDKAVNTKYVVVDLDLENNNKFLNFELSVSKMFHFKGCDVLSSDLYAEYVVERYSNFMRVSTNVEIKPIQHRPGNRVILEMICPGFKKGSCSSKTIKWVCFRCKSSIEYGFNEYFYCYCGRAPKTAFECRCSDAKHGSSFVSLDTNFLTQQLSLLRPFKELNILILGQSGVGKSTWINSITNYLSYEKFQDAKEGGVLCEIPISVTAFSKSSKKYIVKIGEERDSEVTSVGNSATQHSHTYSFLWEDRYVRLIDTPGIGDTRGIEQDKINMRNIFHHIGHLKELHGVCILMKANDCRITAVFSYCLKELLIHLHKSVTKNIIFCFTNARSSFYTPGQTSTLLEHLLDKMDVKQELSLGPHNMFCLDNEAFLFLCTMNVPEIKYEDHLVTSFEQSWDISFRETKRMFDTMKNFQPHSLKDTLSLITARNRILTLTKPITDVSKTIQINLTSIGRKKQEVQNSNKTIEEIKKKLHVTIYELDTYRLEYPRTVCTNASCVDYIKSDDSFYQNVEYKTHCHVECYLKNVEPATTNNSALFNCSAMNKGICKVCGCRWQSHMHIDYGQKRVKKEKENLEAKTDLLRTTSDKEKIEEFIKDLEKKTELYEKEQDIIIQTSVKFGMFLKQNAISVYNDCVEDHLIYLIQEEENKPYKSREEEEILKNLKDTLERYQAEVKVLQEVISNGENSTEPLTSQDIRNLEENLYKLELTGEDIKKSVEMSRSSTAEHMQYSETPLKLTTYQKMVKMGKAAIKFFRK